jgi:hypothetical protein
MFKRRLSFLTFVAALLLLIGPHIVSCMGGTSVSSSSGGCDGGGCDDTSTADPAAGCSTSNWGCSGPTGSDGDGDGDQVNRLTLLSATLNGLELDVADPRLTVAPGEPVTGTVDLQSENYGEPNWVAPLAATPSWGDHRTSFWGIDDWIGIGTQTHRTAVDLQAPETTGSYFVFFAWHHEIEYSNVMSLTHWEHPGGDVWDDEVDVADWDDYQAQEGIINGRVYSQYLNSDGTYGWRYIPGTAVRIEVAEAW